jgi:gamma-polyglutamate synthase
MSERLSAAWIRILLDKGVPALWRQLDRLLADRVVHIYMRWNGRRDVDDAMIGSGGRRLEFARFLRERCEALSRDYARVEGLFHVFLEQTQGIDDPRSVRTAILSTIAELGATRQQLRGDAKAFARWMGPDALIERFDRRRADTERELMFVLDRLGRIGGELAAGFDIPQRIDVWNSLGLQQTLLPLLGFPGHARVRETALRCIRRIVCAAPDTANADRTLLRFAYRSALDPYQPVWMQCEALRLIAHLDPSQLAPIVLRRMDGEAHPEDLFLRRRAVEECVIAGGDAPERLLPRLAADTSDYVRQGVAEALATLPPAWVRRLAPALMNDASPAVAAQALLALPALQRRSDDPDLAAFALQQLEDALRGTDRNAFILRTAMRIAADWMFESVGIEEVSRRLEAHLTRLHQTHPATSLRRAAAEARERLRIRAAGWSAPAIVTALPLGTSASVSAGERDPLPLARALSVAASEGFGFDLERRASGWRIVRDYRWGTRLWRFLHELQHPSTDKRQNYSHLRGRTYRGLLHVPAGRVAEVSRTKVPGEALHLAEEGGWRPWLPLLDQVLSALDQGWPARPLRIVTAEGVTSVDIPQGLFARLRAKWAITRDFARIAALRNWTQESPFAADAYTQALAQHGIRLGFEAHTGLDGNDDPPDPRLLSFFRIDALRNGASVSLLPVLGERSRDYLLSLYQNNIPQLVAFVLALSAWYYGRHLYVNRLFRRARNAIPLVMGGWGTRGKSGTERLKAGVLAGLGLTVVSKTTGCEAMFLYGRTNRPLSEMFLFRPYDKATIWEQADLTRTAAALGADVYLWECMGLNPRYVRILQQRWMRDDVSTITNCFPDHEDIQGPAGVDLPLVISEFVPSNGRLYTSEENMRPYLQAAAMDRGTSCAHIDWLDAGLLTADIIDRFPYQEHPYNIALVARMYADLGLDRDVALKEMADNVVADLGVLKIYPEAEIDGRRIEFINGMSANERHGTISNWLRTGMNAHALDADPGIWTCTVVNNRADRVARSQVFAAMLVNDIGADRHFLIGGNLDGLHQFIRESFDEFMGKFDWDDTSRDRHSSLDGLLRRWRIPRSEHEASARLREACIGLGASLPADGDDDAWLRALSENGVPDARIETLRRQYAQDREDAKTANELFTRIREHAGGLQTHLRDALWALFFARIVTVRDYYTKGNTLIRQIAAAAPPGLRIRCMGIQNIKGTGLDFVYRWQAWDRHAKLCTRMLARQPDIALQAVRTLAGSPELGILEYEHIAKMVALARSSQVSQSDEYQAHLRALEQNMQAAYAKLFANVEKKLESRWRRIFVPKIERLIDGFDAIRRRRTADRIYRDLIDGRVSSQKAVLLLQELTQRQKGGWL